MLNGTHRRAVFFAAGIINSMNMLVVTGKISNSDNRLLLIKKMSESECMREVRIISAKQDQFGKELPEE